MKEKRTDAAGLRDIEATAVRALADKAASLKKRSGVLRVLYARTGAVSPIYGSPTFEGTERLMTLSATGSALQRDAGVWIAQVLRGNIPIGLKITVTGKLPPS